MVNKKALIFGVTGQDGSYLADLLLSKDYQVYGAVRRISNRQLIVDSPYNVIDVDITDTSNVARAIKTIKPDEIYNLAAQSHVAISFEEPAHTWEVTAKGCLNILEAIRNEYPKSRFFQASSSEMFGGTFCQRVHLTDSGGADIYLEKFQDETTPFYPKSPYAVAKLAAHNFTRVYRESYKLFACSGIMFNHESERRGENFVTRKITKYVGSLYQKSCAVNHNKESLKTFPKLKLGNLDVWRDWGHAEDYVVAMHRMLNCDNPNDYIISTGETHSLTEFLQIAFGYIKKDWKEWVEFDESLRRPNEVVYCKGDSSKIRKELGWAPKIKFEQLIMRMVDHEGRERLE